MKKNEKKIIICLICFLLIITSLLLKYTMSLEVLENNSRVNEGSQLVYYLDFLYDGVDRNSLESNATQTIVVNSDYILVEDKIPDGLTFEGFVTNGQTEIGAVRQDGLNNICLGKVVDDSGYNYTYARDNFGNILYNQDGEPIYTTYHGLHYNESTRTISFKIRNLQGGCKLTVGIKTRVPTPEESSYTIWFHNTATATEGKRVVTSNRVSVYIEKLAEPKSQYTVSYTYDSTAPEGIATPFDEKHYVGDTVNLYEGVKVEEYNFLGWEVKSGGVTILNNKFTMPSRDVVLVGRYEKENVVTPDYKVTYSIEGDQPNLDKYSFPIERIYYPNETVIVENDTGISIGDIIGDYEFLGWEVKNSNNPPYVEEVEEGNENETEEDIFDGDTSTNELEKVEITEEIDKDIEAELPAIPITPDISVTTGNVNLIYDATNNRNEFIMPSENVEIVGRFKKVMYNVEYRFTEDSELPDDIENLLPETKSYKEGETISLEQMKSFFGYYFTGWTTKDVSINENTNFIMPQKDVILYGTWHKNNLFELNIEKEVLGNKKYYMTKDNIYYKITVTNNNDFDVKSVSLGELLSGAEFIDYDNDILRNAFNIEAQPSYIVNINNASYATIPTINAHSSVNVYAKYEVTKDDINTVKNEVIINTAITEEENYDFDLSQDYRAEAISNIQSLLTICKEVSGIKNSRQVFQFHITSNNDYDSWMTLSDGECKTIYIEPQTEYTITELDTQEYKMKSVVLETAIDGTLIGKEKVENGISFDVEKSAHYTITFTNNFLRKKFYHSFGRVVNEVLGKINANGLVD